MKKTTLLARKLRKSMTDAERLLWRELRAKRLCGYKFRRQHPVGNYIADFICVDCQLIVELDGGQHNSTQNYDYERSQFLNAKGYRVIRFWNHDVLKNIEGVVAAIVKALEPPPQSSPVIRERR